MHIFLYSNKLELQKIVLSVPYYNFNYFCKFFYAV